MLDVCRHFSPIGEVKRFIDILALHKLNVFHWHLTDDQGWRIEIRRYPALTRTGSVRRGTVVGDHRTSSEYPDEPYGGYYTQDEIREVVAYAAERGIMVIPEIEMPGHAVAALAAYPWLGCTGGPYEVMRTWGVSEDVLCIGKESTLGFLKDVLTEVLELFPSEYIHIGGDESPRKRWKSCPFCQERIRREGLRNEAEAQGRVRAAELFRAAHGEIPERERTEDHRLGRDSGGRPVEDGYRHVVARDPWRHRGGATRQSGRHGSLRLLLFRLLSDA